MAVETEEELAQFTLRLGPMFSRKTRELIAEARREEAVFNPDGDLENVVVCVKPNIDNRYTEEAELHSHDGHSLPARLIPSDQPLQILGLVTEYTRSLKVDDVQFFETKEMVETVQTVRRQKVRVSAAGLRYFFTGEPWPTTDALAEIADEVIDLYAVCDQCGRPAPFNTKYGTGEKVEVGGAETYGAACVFHHSPKPIKK